jgi:hypothetical protein
MKTLFVLIAITALVLPACGASPTATTAGGGETPVHLLVVVQGGLSVKRLGWSDYAPASFGMIVRNGDLLRLDSGAQATLACSDLTVTKAASGVGSVPCKVSKPLLVYGGSLIIPTRAEPPVGIPAILSPRKTKLLTAHPILRWSEVAGATAYDVTVRGGSLTWTSRVTGTTETAYPADAPALAPGASYKLSVTAGSRSSDEEREPGLGFTMLKTDEAQTVREAEARIRALGLGDAATRLLIANLYAGQGLHSEAIDVLRDLAATAPEPAVVRTLGDLYLKVSLNRQAEETYVRALALSQKAGDTEGIAAAYNALGLIYETLGNKTEAVQQSQKAIEWYQKLGDSKTIKQIQDRLTALQRP